MGWRAAQKSLLLPVAGEFFLLTLPFIERGIVQRCCAGVCRSTKWGLNPGTVQLRGLGEVTRVDDLVEAILNYTNHHREIGRLPPWI